MSDVPRDLELEGVWNLRDLGGLEVAGGGRTRRNQLFRSGTLWFATMADCELLDALKIYTLIDLRLPHEEVREGNWVPELLDYRYHDISIEVPDDPTLISLVHGGGPEHYVRLLEHNAAKYIRALRVISEPYNHPLLFHCAAGLDRTSVLAALVLACLDVEEHAIVADHVASDPGVRRIVENYRGHALYGAAAEASSEGGADPAVMIGFLKAFGGASGLKDWALANGLAQEALAEMRAALVEK